MDEKCKLGNGLRIKKTELYSIYRDWCKESGLRPLGRNKFYRQFEADFPFIRQDRPTGTEWYYDGIKAERTGS